MVMYRVHSAQRFYMFPPKRGFWFFQMLHFRVENVARHFFLSRLTRLRRTSKRTVSPLVSASWRCVMRDLKLGVIQAGSLEQDFILSKGSKMSIPVRITVLKVISLSAQLWLWLRIDRSISLIKVLHEGCSIAWPQVSNFAYNSRFLRSMSCFRFKQDSQVIRETKWRQFLRGWIIFF